MRLWLSALAVAVLTTVAPPAFAAETAALKTACEAVGTNFVGEDNTAKVPVFCGCLAGELSVRPQADIDILAKDLQGASTDADRAAHGDYEAVEETARDAVNVCLRQNGMEDLADPVEEEEQGEVPFVTPDMTAFDAKCRASQTMLAFLEGARDLETARTAVCDCLVREFPLNFQQSVVDLFAKDLDGTSSDAEKEAFLNFSTFESRAADIMEQCLAPIPRQ